MKTDNELFRDFMELEISKGVVYDTRTHYKIPYYHDSLISAIDDFRYHISWDWLMPVVEKIGKLYEEAFPKNDEFIRRIMAKEDPIDKEYIDVISTSIYTPIDEVYQIVVEFIKWHNAQKP
jgi:hypothetical protein